MGIAYELVGTAGEDPVPVPPGPPRLVGRQATCDIPIYDGSISRDHATVSRVDDGIEVKDLGSTNGTFLNGVKISEAVARDGDTVTFGGVSLRLRRVGVQSAVPVAPPAESLESKIVRKLPVKLGSSSGVVATQGSAGYSASFLNLVRGMPDDRPAAKLEVLLEITKELARQKDLDALFRRIADLILTVAKVDRVCIMTVEGDTLELVPRIAKGRRGGTAKPDMVPRSIAYQAVAERVAILSEDIGRDERFDSMSARIQVSRSALCVPLAGDQSEVLGILYVDKAGDNDPLGEEDLEFMTALGNLAAVAIENRQLQDRGRREGDELDRLRKLLSPNQAAELLAPGASALLAANKRLIVLLTVEICELAARIDRMPAAEVGEVVNAYCVKVMETIFQYGGTLIHVVGHTVIAIWGSPIARPDDAERALRAAQEIRAGIEELNADWSKRGRARIEIGMGISQGDVFVGQVGTRQRSEYTVIGRALDQATTLARAARRGEILVSDVFLAALSNQPRNERARLEGLDMKAFKVS